MPAYSNPVAQQCFLWVWSKAMLDEMKSAAVWLAAQEYGIPVSPQIWDLVKH